MTVLGGGNQESTQEPKRYIYHWKALKFLHNINQFRFVSRVGHMNVFENARAPIMFLDPNIV